VSIGLLIYNQEIALALIPNSQSESEKTIESGRRSHSSSSRVGSDLPEFDISAGVTHGEYDEAERWVSSEFSDRAIGPYPVV